jgi:c-di-GMP-binding flagellar brake protein YcgR
VVLYLLGRPAIKKKRSLMMKERRKHPRVKTEDLIDYVCMDEHGNKVDEGMGRVLDISQGGLLLESHGWFKSQHIVLMTFDRKNETINLEGKVVYCREEESGRFRAGVQFLGANGEIRQNVVKLIKTFRILKER